MCDVCGCGEPRSVTVEVHERLTARNDRDAAHNREHFQQHGLAVVNLMGAPGAGKTALLEATARHGPEKTRLMAITGDLETENDAMRLRRWGVPTHAITTGTACHLDASMVHRALHAGSFHGPGILFVENVGNLVCPAIYDLGQAANVVLVSVTEGEDKPLKYPVMFRAADLVVVTKTDLLPALPDFRPDALTEAVATVAPGIPVLSVSARGGQGLEAWIAWLLNLTAGAARGEAASAGRPGASDPSHRHP